MANDGESHYFEIGDHKIKIFEQKLVFYDSKGKVRSKQKIVRTNCTCMRGSLINPKYGTTCKHINACYAWLIMEQLKNGKEGIEKTN